jgi:DNA-directed RNA polymerase subunit RPC12/RpoP
MGEKEFHVIPKKILFKCEECKDGWLMFQNQVKEGINGRPLFLHKCHKCGKRFDMKKQYPMIKFDEITDKKLLNEMEK